jgi:hypothetical protein
MVGTRKVSVPRSSAMACSTGSSSKPGSTTWRASRCTSCSTRAMPPTWNIGAQWMPTLSIGRVAARLADSALVTRLAWLCITPLGRPVVPPVYITAARSLPLRRASATGVAAATSVGPSMKPSGAWAVAPVHQLLQAGAAVFQARCHAVEVSSTSRMRVSQSSNE